MLHLDEPISLLSNGGVGGSVSLETECVSELFGERPQKYNPGPKPAKGDSAGTGKNKAPRAGRLAPPSQQVLGNL